ncbi:MAG: hypothetical protein LBQ38_07430 [Spirochaetaceae bacterium]|jgi:hypothetical protein|nr:hypothetical protein [Spirochaetaceae bacterium]
MIKTKIFCPEQNSPDRAGGRKAEPRDGGFTIPEVLAGICVISTCMFLLLGTYSSSTLLFVRSRERIFAAVKLLRADTRIRRELGAVVIPYWEREAGIVQNPGEIIIPWYGGIRDHTLGFRVEGNSLVMETTDDRGTERHVIREPADRITLTLLQDENRLPRGIDLTFTGSGGDLHSMAYFSSIPLGGGRP